MKVSGSQIRSHLEDRMSDGDSLLSGKAVVEIEQVSPPEGKFISEIKFNLKFTLKFTLKFILRFILSCKFEHGQNIIWVYNEKVCFRY